MNELEPTERKRVADEIGIGDAYLYQCLTGRKVLPKERAPALERATYGSITCEQSCPDIAWVRVPDKSWPWHPKGRPLVDVAAEAKAG